eukprot:7093810-Pyramimonas_sp.AAC.1
MLAACWALAGMARLGARARCRCRRGPARSRAAQDRRSFARRGTDGGRLLSSSHRAQQVRGAAAVQRGAQL